MNVENINDECTLDLSDNSQFENFVEPIPQIKMREGVKNINPNVLKILTILNLGVGISLRNSILALIVTANHMFGQNWKLQRREEFTGHKRVMRCLPPTNDKQGAPAKKKKTDDFTAVV